MLLWIFWAPLPCLNLLALIGVFIVVLQSIVLHPQLLDYGMQVFVGRTWVRRSWDRRGALRSFSIGALTQIERFICLSTSVLFGVLFLPCSRDEMLPVHQCSSSVFSQNICSVFFWLNQPSPHVLISLFSPPLFAVLPQHANMLGSLIF